MNDKECQEFLKTVCAGGEASTLRASDCGKRTRGRQVPFLKDRKVVTSLCHGNKISGSQQTEVLQIWQKKRKRKKMTCMQSFLCMMALGNKTVAHTWLPSFDNENSRLCRDPEILLISLDWLSLDKRFSKIMALSVDTQYISSVNMVVTFVSSPNSSQQRFSRAD